MANCTAIKPAYNEIAHPLQIVALERALEGTFTLTGGALAQSGTPNMKVNMDAWTGKIAGAAASVAGGFVTADAQDATFDRIDVVYITAAGALALHKGTIAAIVPSGLVTGDWKKFETPRPADATMPAGVILGLVHIKSTANGGGTIVTADIYMFTAYGQATPKIDDLTAADDNTDLNVSNSAHGLCPKPSSSDVNLRLNGLAAWQNKNWTPETNFTARPPSTSTITMTADRTAIIKVGMGLKYTWNGTTYYGVVSAIASNLLTVAGAPLSTSYDVTALYWCDPSRVIQVDFFVSGTFADAANTALLNSDMDTAFDWNLGKAYCVLLRHKVKTDDSGAAQPNVTISIAGAVVGTDNTNAGQAVAETWTSTVVGINTSNYDINPDEAIEVVTDASGTKDDASDLTVSAVFVLE